MYNPSEMNNIYGKEGTEAITTELKKRLVELQKEYGEEEYIAQ